MQIPAELLEQPETDFGSIEQKTIKIIRVDKFEKTGRDGLQGYPVWRIGDRFFKTEKLVWKRGARRVDARKNFRRQLARLQNDLRATFKQNVNAFGSVAGGKNFGAGSKSFSFFDELKRRKRIRRQIAK